jgi:hypothetical protein
LEAQARISLAYLGLQASAYILCYRAEAPLWDGGLIGVRKLWSYYAQYLYMPRLAGFGVLAAAISDAVAQVNWAEETFAFAEGQDPESDRYLGLTVGQHVDVGVSQAAVLVHPGSARRQLDEEIESPSGEGEDEPGNGEGDDEKVTLPDQDSPTRFYARKELDPVRAIRDFGDLVNEVAKNLGTADGADVTITVEINAESSGFDDRIRRTVSENATQLGFDAHEFEE